MPAGRSRRRQGHVAQPRVRSFLSLFRRRALGPLVKVNPRGGVPSSVGILLSSCEPAASLQWQIELLLPRPVGNLGNQTQVSLRTSTSLLS